MSAKVRHSLVATRAKAVPTLTSISQQNNHSAAISTHANSKAPCIKLIANSDQVSSHVTKWRIFQYLDGQQPTAASLDGISAWFLKIGAPFIAAHIADKRNLSLSMGVVPTQWKIACILPILKIPDSLSSSVYRMPIPSRIIERIVVQDYPYLSSFLHQALSSSTKLPSSQALQYQQPLFTSFIESPIIFKTTPTS